MPDWKVVTNMLWFVIVTQSFAILALIKSVYSALNRIERLELRLDKTKSEISGLRLLVRVLGARPPVEAD